MENKEFIYTYTRQMALADGLQVRCPDDIRKEAGIKFPVFFTRTLWDEYIMPPEECEDEGQSLDGRLWDALYMWAFNVRAQRPDGNRMVYKVIFIMPRKVKTNDRSGKSVTVTLESVIGPTDFDDPSPAITIMLPGED
jgi:hypothetical protein